MPLKTALPRICIALGLPSVARLLEHARREVEAGERFFEFRLDYLPDPCEGARAIRDFLAEFPDCLILATCRRHQNQGRFNGSVEEQIRILECAVENGARAVDVEVESAAGIRGRLENLRSRVTLVVSYHNFESTPALEAVVRRLTQVPADAYKIVTTARKQSDNYRVLSIAANHPRTPLILLAMGETGFPTRVLSPFHGGIYTYAAPNTQEGTAGGQCAARVLRNLEGLVRVRNGDLEVFYGHVLSGVSGLLAAYTDTPSGGPGFSSAFPQGPSLKKLAPNEPISIDLAACVNGYVVDMTRMYALGSLPSRVWEAWDAVEELYRLFTGAARPGANPGEIFRLLWDAARARGLGDCFMGREPDRVSFLAHGVGLELDEYPFITARFPLPLEADMVLAFEPKFFLPEIGMIGQEDTGRITPKGVEWLTHSPRGITLV